MIPAHDDNRFNSERSDEQERINVQLMDKQDDTSCIIAVFYKLGILYVDTTPWSLLQTGNTIC